MPVSVGVDAGGQLMYVVRGPWCVTAPDEPSLRTTHYALRTDVLTHHEPRTTNRIAVEAVLDSWQLDDEWWRQRISRRYVAVMLEDGKRMLLFEDLVTGEWFEQRP